jgi:mycofactocin precursor
MQENTAVTDTVAGAAAVGEAPADASAPAAETLVEDVLVEEVSIDGMCGVY